MPNQCPSHDKRRGALFALEEATSLSQQRQIIEREQAVLLTDAALEFLAAWIEAEEDSGDDEAQRQLESFRSLLTHCRDEGMEAAFAKGKPSTSPSSPLPSADVLALFTERKRPARLSDMPRRVEVCREALALVTPKAQPELWAALQVVLCDSLCQNPLGNRASNLEEAIKHATQALNSGRCSSFRPICHSESFGRGIWPDHTRFLVRRTRNDKSKSTS